MIYERDDNVVVVVAAADMILRHFPHENENVHVRF